MKYKFLRSSLQSDNGNLSKWEIGKWKHEDTLDMCHFGFHCSRYPDQAFSYVQGEILAIVETKGKSIIQDNKECWSDMRIVKAYHWQKKDSVALAIYAAELVIDIYEKQYPNDDRPRKAIEAAKAWTKHPTEKNVKAAAKAVAEWNAEWEAAKAAAWAAAKAAAAAWAAAKAVEAAEALAAEAAVLAWAAEWNAAETAEWKASLVARVNTRITSKIRTWMLKRIKTLDEV
jgi:hypothetical protein